MGGDDVPAQGDAGGAEALVEAGGDGGRQVPGAEQPGQAGRHHLDLADLVAGGGGRHHRRGDRGGQHLDDPVDRAGAGPGREAGTLGHRAGAPVARRSPPPGSGSARRRPPPGSP